MKSRIVTERTSSTADKPVPVGTCEAGIDYKFLKSLAIEPAVMPDISIVPFAIGEIIFAHIGDKFSQKM